MVKTVPGTVERLGLLALANVGKENSVDPAEPISVDRRCVHRCARARAGAEIFCSEAFSWNIVVDKEQWAMQSLPDPFFGGFMPKKVVTRPGWLKNPVVEEICSISERISKAPARWMDQWKHNDLGLYDTMDAAQAVIPPRRESDYNLFAFQVYPIRFSAIGIDAEDQLIGKANVPQTKLQGWEFLGYDLAGRSTGNYFECSPLSCNYCAENGPVNRYCLLDDLEAAVQNGIEFGNPESGVEPGPYYLVEVYRKRSVGSPAGEADPLFTEALWA